MQYSPLESKIEALISPALEADGFTLVRIRVSQGDDCVVQIMAEHIDGTGISLDECARISRTISAKLDVEDPIAVRYSLEVSSPGMERPLTKLSDFDKYAEREIKLTINNPIDGRKRFKGTLRGTAGDQIVIFFEADNTSKEIQIPYEDIATANLLVTEDSIRKILSKNK